MTNTKIQFAIATLALFAISLSGCSKDPFPLSPVAGQVTVDGQPAANVHVMFTPLPNATTSIVGPFSSAVTDSDGKFVMKTKQGKPGAVIGKHSVDIQYTDFDPEEASELQSRIQEAKAMGEDASKHIAELKAFKNKKPIPEEYAETELELTAEGLPNFMIEVKTK